MTPAMRNVVIAAAFPPPLHGLSKISASVATDLAKLAIVRRYDLSSRSMARSPAYHWRRFVSVVTAAGGILRNGLRPDPCMYIPADGGWGLLYTLILTSFARISWQDIIVHHHSFSAIDRHQTLMSLLVAVGGRRATHIFLCDVMQRRFRESYSGGWKALISSNAAHLPLSTERPSENSGPIRLGLLSNLTRAKGLYIFLDVVRACLARGIPVEGRLAGPIENATDAAAVEVARSEFGDHLAYLGPLYGADKDRFLSEVDVFVFPTTYRNEAQPNAVFEAMAAGTAVAIFARGCLGEDVTDACGLLVDPAADFVSDMVAQIVRWHSDRAMLIAAQAASRRRFAERRAIAVEGYQELLAVIAGR